MPRSRLLLASLLPVSVFATEPAPLVLELPLYDAPYNDSDGYTAPSMRQSLAITKDFYQYAHHQIAEWFPNRRQAELWTIIGLDFVFTWLPPGDSWLHEEWHRAVMGQYGIDSYNDVYNLPLFAETIAVSHVRDADLIELKREHPADQVRLSAAGLEAQNEFVTALEKDAFFAGVRNRNVFLLWTNLANNTLYLDTCASDEANIITAEAYADEGTSVSKRDFTGLDCNAWVYDLHRPDEPYEARGTHPSGVGIDRYIDWSDLTVNERKFLRRQRNLSLLSFVDPFLFGFNDGFRRGDMRWSGNLRHQLTPFGYSIDANVFARSPALDVFATVHWYRNARHAYPGLSVEFRDLSVPRAGTPLRMSITTALWQQPKSQRFDTSRGTVGGELATRFDVPLSAPWSVFMEADWKTDGWVAGNVYLERNFSARVGVGARWGD